MKIFIGADHRGFLLKQRLVKFLQNKGYETIDVGTYIRKPPCDYPAISRKVGLAVSKTKNALGILACMTGLGHAIAANKIPGVRAALCYTRRAAVLSREHNNANILILGAKFTASQEIPGIIGAWIKTKFAGGRHLRRVNQIKRIEKEFCNKKR